VSDVLIVGAGIAGLSVAAQLLSARPELSVCVLEARDRVGGRIESVDALDCGATWFWPGEERVAALVARFRIQTHAQHLAGDALFLDRSRRVRRLDGNPLDSPAMRFSAGAASLCTALAGSLPDGVVRLLTAVTRVSFADDLFTVSTRDGGVLHARHVVLALPPALAVSAIEFQPPLPADVRRVASHTPVWMGRTLKCVIKCRSAFWRQAGLSGSAVCHVGPIQELHDMSGVDGVPAALLGFAAAPVSEAAVVEQLALLFGSSVADQIESVILRDWAAEEFTSPPNVAALTDFSLFGHRAFQTPVDGRLHWTSTETSDNNGHMEGALEAAERCSQALLQRL
jgi:monoamine oxidase